MASPTTPIALDEHGRLANDLMCGYCDYNLRGLSPDGVCCECGQPVQIALWGTRLGSADPRWVNRIRDGMVGLAMLLPWVWLPLAWPLLLIAAWMVTTPNPGAKPDTLSSVVLRILLAPVFLGPPLAAAFSNTASLVWNWDDFLLALGGSTALLALWIALAIWRLSDHAAGKGVRRLLLCVLIVWVVAAVLAGASIATSWGLPPGFSTPDYFACGAISAGLAGIVLLPLGTLLLWREFARAAVLAATGGPRIKVLAWRSANSAQVPTPPNASGAAPLVPA